MKHIEQCSIKRSCFTPQQQKRYMILQHLQSSRKLLGMFRMCYSLVLPDDEAVEKSYIFISCVNYQHLYKLRKLNLFLLPYPSSAEQNHY